MISLFLKHTLWVSFDSCSWQIVLKFVETTFIVETTMCLKRVAGEEDSDVYSIVFFEYVGIEIEIGQGFFDFLSFTLIALVRNAQNLKVIGKLLEIRCCY